MADIPSATAGSLKLYPCPGCNAQLVFDPGVQELDCTHCGTRIRIDKGRDRIVELELRAHLTRVNTPVSEPVTQYVYTCTRCSTSNTFSSETPSFTCSSCKFQVVNPEAFRTRDVQPAGILPFIIDKPRALDIYKSWISKGFWQPGKLKTVARADLLEGIYLPFWTFDAQTGSQWSGYAGTYYWDTEYYTDSQGKRQSRSVRKTQWTYRSGDYNHFFDDILVGGSNLLSQQECGAVFPFDLQTLVNFSPDFLSGWQADVYDIALADGYTLAEDIMKNEICSACAALCSDDTYRDLEVNTSYSEQTYKHILLPLWVCSYLYRGNTWNFIINGQTGKICGDKPVSRGKVAIAIILIVAVVLILIAVFNNT